MHRQPGQPTRQTGQMHPANLSDGVTPPEDGHRSQVPVMESRDRPAARQGQHRAGRVAPRLDRYLGQHGQCSAASWDFGTVADNEDFGVALNLEGCPDHDPTAGPGGGKAICQGVGSHPGRPDHRSGRKAAAVLEYETVLVHFGDQSGGLDLNPSGPKGTMGLVLQVRRKGRE